MFQGEKALRLRTGPSPTFDVPPGSKPWSYPHAPRHIGRVPRLVKQGFAGRSTARRRPRSWPSLLLDARTCRRKTPATSTARACTEARPALPLFDESGRAGGAASFSGPCPYGRRARWRRVCASPTGTPDTSWAPPRVGGERCGEQPRNPRPLQRRRGALRRRADERPRARADSRLPRRSRAPTATGCTAALSVLDQLRGRPQEAPSRGEGSSSSPPSRWAERSR